MDHDRIFTWAVDQTTLRLSSIHGTEHWMKVWKNDQTLAAATRGCDVDLVYRVALGHDYRRVNEAGIRVMGEGRPRQLK